MYLQVPTYWGHFVMLFAPVPELGTPECWARKGTPTTEGITRGNSVVQLICIVRLDFAGRWLSRWSPNSADRSVHCRVAPFILKTLVNLTLPEWDTTNYAHPSGCGRLPVCGIISDLLRGRDVLGCVIAVFCVHNSFHHHRRHLALTARPNGACSGITGTLECQLNVVRRKPQRTSTLVPLHPLYCLRKKCTNLCTSNQSHWGVRFSKLEGSAIAVWSFRS